MIRMPTAILTLLMTAALTSPALAFDLNGTWSGTRKCQDLFSGVKVTFTDAVTFRIAEDGNAIGIQVDIAGSNSTSYAGLANFPAAKPDKGEFAMIHCGSNDVVGDALAFDAIGRMQASTKPGKIVAKIKGLSLFSDNGTSPGMGTCKWSLTRSNLTPAGVATACESGGASRRAAKKNIQYLSDEQLQRLHDDLLAFRLASWQYTLPGSSSATHFGFIIDDVEPSPSIAENGNSVDLYGYASMAVAAVQTQAREIAELKRTVTALQEHLPKRDAPSQKRTSRTTR